MADTGNTGRINGETIHHGNFIAYTGPDMGVNSIWRPGNVLQRWGNGWRLVRLEAGNLDKYLVALPDIARGTNQVIAGRVMTETLLSDEVFARTMFATLIHADVINILCHLNVGNTANGIQIRGSSSANAVDSEIRSANFVERVSGIRLRGDGQLDANNARINGALAGGGAWDSNGSDVNPSASGLFVPVSAVGTFVRARRLEVRQRLSLTEVRGGSKPSLEIERSRTDKDGAFTVANASRVPEAPGADFVGSSMTIGTFTRNALATRLNNYVGAERSDIRNERRILLQGWATGAGITGTVAIASMNWRPVSGILVPILYGVNPSNPANAETEIVLNNTQSINVHITFI